jgi:Flp pilus assembly protein TadD/peroxiredoxin
MGLAPIVFRAAPFFASPLLSGSASNAPDDGSSFSFADVRLVPHYPQQSPLADILRLVPPGSDDYVTEKYASEIEEILRQWGRALVASPQGSSALGKVLAPSLFASLLTPTHQSSTRTGFGIDGLTRSFAPPVQMARELFLSRIHAWIGPVTHVDVAEFEIYSLTEVTQSPLRVLADIRYDLAATRSDGKREERIGSWRTEWRAELESWIADRWEVGEETLSVGQGAGFIDVTAHALASTTSYREQMLRSVDHWRTVLDGAIGTDVYSNNGVAAGDYDNDGLDDFYVCQPAGLPNRLYRNRGDGTFEDTTDRAGVGVLDNTACALFADFDNRGLQDLLVVCGTGPLLFRNQGNGTFALKPDAFRFATPPQGTFTHAAIADYDRDGRLDVYFCLYMYYLGLDQYHYPAPYYDARNGPPNCLLHNEGGGHFVEVTAASGLNADNDRYSFSCAWGDSNSNGLPDLFVANDFGSSQLYRNNGDGTFTVASKEAHVEDVGAGMSCCWSDFDNDGHQDIYVPSMWESAGQRVSGQDRFHRDAPREIRNLYQRHARGNALYRNRGDGTFANIGHQAAVDMGRWSWSSDFWDVDHDGYADLYVTNGYISSQNREDLASFFWRQVVAKSPEDASPSPAYERGWNAINELIRSDHTWHGYARNILFANNRNGTFSEVSAVLGMDFLEDSRSFALADIDHDGRLEVILKNRNAPQLRILHNGMKDIGDSIAFRLRGHSSNRDAIGASITVKTRSLCQTKYLQAGSGFLAQHSKELHFGVGHPDAPLRATVRWPNGNSQEFENLPVNHRIHIEEGIASFTTEPFAAAPPAYAKRALDASLQPLPLQVETWLCDPLKAPEFSAPSVSGQTIDLKQFRGAFVLLTFWSTASPASIDQLKAFEHRRNDFATHRLTILALNADTQTELHAAQAAVRRDSFSMPIAFASEEVLGIYNILYRYLFDRRRDLPVPVSFLLNPDAMIVKVYQGTVDIEHLLEDLKSVPTTSAERMRKALPFDGDLYHGSFERNDFTYGVAMIQQGYFKQAEESFLEVVAAKPDNPDGYYNLGTLSLKRKDFQQARAYLDKTLTLRPDYPEAWNNLGMIAAEQGHADEAIQALKKSIALRPSYATALLNLGNVYRLRRDFSDAQSYLERALAAQPEDADVHYGMGMLYAQQDRIEGAIDHLQRAVDLRPGYVEALNNLGVLYVRSNDFSNAETRFRSGIRVAPNFDQSYLNLARLYSMQNNVGKAREVLAELLRIQPDNVGANQALEMLR